MARGVDPPESATVNRPLACTAALAWRTNRSAATRCKASASATSFNSYVMSPAGPALSGRTQWHRLAGIDAHDRCEQVERLRSLALKHVATDDRPKPAAGMDAADLVQDVFVAPGGAAREDHHTAAVEAALHDM